MIARSFERSWRAGTRGTVPERGRMTSDSGAAPGPPRPPPRRTAAALEDGAVGDAGGGEEAVVAGAEVVRGEDALEVVAAVERRRALLLVARPEAADQLPAHRLQGGGGDHALGGAADPPQKVDRGAFAHRQQGGGDVAVGDQADAGARVTDFLHRLLMAGAVEHDYDDVADRAPLALGDQLQGLRQRPVEVEQVG